MVYSVKLRSDLLASLRFSSFVRARKECSKACGEVSELGKHFVVRDMNDVMEVRKIAEVYDQMGEQDRLTLYAARKAHKELVVFLHEWAHTLGALHERGDGRIMGPNYDRQASTFSVNNTL